MKLRRARLLLCCAVLNAVPCTLLRAQDGPILDQQEDTSKDDTPAGPSISRAEYMAQIASMQVLLQSCQAQADRCEAKAVPGNEAVEGGFRVRWDWLRDALQKASDGKSSERGELLGNASARLNEDAAEASGATAATVSLAETRRQANEVLSRAEFRKVEQNSYLQQKIAAVMLILDRLFDGMANLVPHSPWVSIALEWGLLGAAAIGVVLWAWRTSRQQRILLTAPREMGTLWQKESDDWADKAEVEAARGEWREAVHCLYWAAIVMLEGQRLWRRNRARTPREYVLLLEPGSRRRDSLGGLTRVFERIWYGLRPATPGDYERAVALLAELKAG